MSDQVKVIQKSNIEENSSKKIASILKKEGALFQEIIESGYFLTKVSSKELSKVMGNELDYIYNQFKKLLELADLDFKTSEYTEVLRLFKKACKKENKNEYSLEILELAHNITNFFNIKLEYFFKLNSNFTIKNQWEEKYDFIGQIFFVLKSITYSKKVNRLLKHPGRKNYNKILNSIMKEDYFSEDLLLTIFEASSSLLKSNYAKKFNHDFFKDNLESFLEKIMNKHEIEIKNIIVLERIFYYTIYLNIRNKNLIAYLLDNLTLQLGNLSFENLQSIIKTLHYFRRTFHLNKNTIIKTLIINHNFSLEVFETYFNNFHNKMMFEDKIKALYPYLFINGQKYNKGSKFFQ